MPRLPYFRIYPSDRLGDSDLMALPLATQGVFFRMLCAMAQSEQRGFLSDSNGKPRHEEWILTVVGGERTSAKSAIAALLEAGIFRKRADGAIFCPKMVAETEKMDADKERKPSVRGKVAGKSTENRRKKEDIPESIIQSPESRVLETTTIATPAAAIEIPPDRDAADFRDAIDELTRAGFHPHKAYTLAQRRHATAAYCRHWIAEARRKGSRGSLGLIVKAIEQAYPIEELKGATGPPKRVDNSEGAAERLTARLAEEAKQRAQRNGVVR